VWGGLWRGDIRELSRLLGIRLLPLLLLLLPCMCWVLYCGLELPGGSGHCCLLHLST
jgi:hypothetical protein